MITRTACDCLAAHGSGCAQAKAVNEDGTEAHAEEADEEPADHEKKAPVAPSKAELEAANKNKQLSAKARQYLQLALSFLQRDKQAAAVVEFVFSASRFKLLVPKENVIISFALAGIRTSGLRPAPWTVR